jgi:hypothetical protein
MSTDSKGNTRFSENLETTDEVGRCGTKFSYLHRLNHCQVFRQPSTLNLSIKSPSTTQDLSMKDVDKCEEISKQFSTIFPISFLFIFSI